MNFSDVINLAIPEGDVFSITDGNGTVIWEKPSGNPYTFVEYIQGTGTQYIDTGIQRYNLGETYSLDMSIDTVQTQNILFSNNYDVAINFYKSSSTRFTLYAKYANTSYSQRTNLTISTYKSRHIWSLKNGQVLVNGNSVMNPTSGSSSLTTQGTIKLFTGTGSSCTQGKIYGFTVVRSGFPSSTTIMDLVPAIRNSDNAVGMYDQINDTFYNNAGMNVFIAGPPV